MDLGGGFGPEGVGATISGEGGAIEIGDHAQRRKFADQPVPFGSGERTKLGRAVWYIRIGPPLVVVERTLARVTSQHLEPCRFRSAAAHRGSPGETDQIAGADAGNFDFMGMHLHLQRSAEGSGFRTGSGRGLGMPIQGLQWMLADMATDIAAARGLSLMAVMKRARGERFSLDASMAKLYASEMVGRAPTRPCSSMADTAIRATFRWNALCAMHAS